MSKADSARLILHLYKLRREPILRDARDWFVARFHPMAAALVNHGAIDPAMFNDANTEHNAVYTKMQPFLPELRRRSGLPDYLDHLERLVLSQPAADARLEVFRPYLAAKAAFAGTPAALEAR